MHHPAGQNTKEKREYKKEGRKEERRKIKMKESETRKEKED
jgi:hypothetical protein